MATKTQTWTPWHKVVDLRDDVRTGELSMAIFAADLDAVARGGARKVYQEPTEFFSLTYPTFALRDLAKDVATRLAGKSDKAVRQLELTYGGGKTHALITLYHLAHDPTKLPNLPAVAEFTNHIGFTPPRARVAVLPFDKLDVEKGMDVRSPQGAGRWLKHPWSVLAYQIAGDEGLALLHAEGKAEERETAPAEPLLVTLLAIPQKEDLSTLVLIDEVLMFVREKVALDPSWRDHMLNFFQYLTQAAAKVDRAAVVASLLATDPLKNDALGKELANKMATIFRREGEQSVQPVSKDDVAEVLRRRFFKPESIRDREAFRPHVVAALKGIVDLDEQTKKDNKGAEDRLLKSYPFHPDLTDTLYTKWTQLEGFQRTRGVLRTFALALKDAERWDDGPLVGANVFLGDPKTTDLSEGARDLAGVAAREEYEGKKQEWPAILEGELSKAREIQAESTTLKHREVEQAVFATFLHSQPIGQKALTRDLMLLVGPTRPDKIVLEKALLRWTETSWFLDEGGLADAEQTPSGARSLPKSWRLGNRPNLRQMHHDASTRIQPELIEALLGKEIGKTKSLTAGAQSAGAKVHVLSERPRDIEDDGEFRYVVLGPKGASEVGKPSAEAKRFIEEHTGPDKPRVNKNAVVLAVPSRDGLELARQRIREYLGWEEVTAQLKDQQLDPVRTATLTQNVETSKKKIPEAIVQAYGIVVTLSQKNEIVALKVAPGEDSLFVRIKNTPEARIMETEVSAEALLPDGPYDLWHEGDTARRMNDLAGAFAQLPRLPKMLKRRAIVETLVAGCKSGLFVLRVPRPDRSVKSTYWRQTPGEDDLKEPGLEVVLPEAATLVDIESDLLLPGALPGLWAGDTLRVGDLAGYFAGGKTIKIPREGYEDVVIVPKAERDAVEKAAAETVKAGKLWLTNGDASVLGEAVPPGLLTDDAVLQAPPSALQATDVLRASLPEAWTDESTTALDIARALSVKEGKALPWSIVREAIDGALRSRLLERTFDSTPWPVDLAGAAGVKLAPPTTSLREPRLRHLSEPPRVAPLPLGTRVAEGELHMNELQTLAEVSDKLKRAAVGYEVKLSVRIEIGGKPVGDDVVEKVNAVLAEVSEGLRLR
jgi:Protein of unknown function (DUF499)